MVDSVASCILLSILLLGAGAAGARVSRLTETKLNLRVGEAINAELSEPLYMSGYFKVCPTIFCHIAFAISTFACTSNACDLLTFPEVVLVY